MPNPDTVYRYIPVSSDSTYVITGHRGTSDDISFQLIDQGPELKGQLQTILGSINTSQLQVAPDGTFQITLDSNPSNGTPNHIQLVPDARRIMIRDTMSDWSETPMTLEVTRTGGPTPGPAANDETLATLAASMLTNSVPLWIKIPPIYNYNSPINTIPAAHPTGSGGLNGQYITNGAFSLSDSQALVITVGQGTAKYFGLQTGSNWYISYDYITHTSSLNGFQSAPNPDGSYTYVISLQDPGVANWIDPVGHHEGLILMRWQGLSAPLPADAQPIVQLVNLSDLSSALPAGTPTITPQGRQQQIETREQQIAARGPHLPA
jgi:hypothetical protein